MPRHFSIWIVTPPGYPHSRCFEEVALGLRAAFAQLGYEAPIVTDPQNIPDTAIVLGPHLLPLAAQDHLPPRLILYNLEQILPNSPWLNSDYIDLLRKYPVWDYCQSNIAHLAGLGISNVTLCGIGFMPALTRITAAVEDIDVLFIGSIEPRRHAVLQQIAAQGCGVHTAFNVYGNQRDALIARAKIVLNLHLYESKIFEIVRVSYLLANRKCVVSESGADAALEQPLRDGIAFAPYADLADTVIRLLKNAAQRARLAEKGFQCFSALSQVPMLERALGALPPSPQ